MQNYLDEYFENDDKKQYHITDKKPTAEIWKAGHNEYRIKWSAKFHMSANEHGNWKMKVCPNDLNDNIFFLNNLHDAC